MTPRTQAEIERLAICWTDTQPGYRIMREQLAQLCAIAIGEATAAVIKEIRG